MTDVKHVKRRMKKNREKRESKKKIKKRKYELLLLIKERGYN